MSKGNGKTWGTPFAENTRKFQTKLQVLKLLTIHRNLLGNITNTFCSWSTCFLLENRKPVSLLCQAKLLSQLTTVIKKMNTEWADDSIVDLDREVSNTSGDTQEAEVVSAAQKDPPAGQSMKPLKKPIIHMKREPLKSDAIKQLLSLEKRMIEQFEKMHESKKTCEELEKDADCHFLMSLLPHLRNIPKRRKLSIRTRLQKF